MFKPPVKVDPADIKQAKKFLDEIIDLCKKYNLSFEGGGDYGIKIYKYTDDQHHRENEVMDCIWSIGPEGIERE